MVKKQDEFQQQVELYKKQLMQLQSKVIKTQAPPAETSNSQPPRQQDDAAAPIEPPMPPAGERTASIVQRSTIPPDLPVQYAQPEMFNEEDPDVSRAYAQTSAAKPEFSVEKDTDVMPIHYPDQFADPETLKDRITGSKPDADAETEQSRDAKPPPGHRQDQSDTLSQADIDSQYLKNGYLQINAAAAGMALPVSGARCVVSKLIDDKKHVYYRVLTDENGRTEELELPTPDKGLSESARRDGPLPYALYHLEISKDGFKQISNYNVPVFDGILSVQDVNMIPLADSDDASEEITLDASYPR